MLVREQQPLDVGARVVPPMFVRASLLTFDERAETVVRRISAERTNSGSNPLVAFSGSAASHGQPPGGRGRRLPVRIAHGTRALHGRCRFHLWRACVLRLV